MLPFNAVIGMNKYTVYIEIMALLFHLHLTELKLITRPVTTTTPTPHVHATKKKHKPKDKDKDNHKDPNAATQSKDAKKPNGLQENDIQRGNSGGNSMEGTYS